MLNISKILLAIDFSEGVEERFIYARDLARRMGAELHVLYAYVLHGDRSELDEHPDSESVAMAALERMSDRLDAAERGSLAVSVTLVVERSVTAASAILDYASAQNVDVILMGTHGRRGFRRMLLGSVAEEVLRLSNCPVLTIRPPAEKTSRNGIASHPILVPIDFSAHSAHALQYAKELAALYGTRLELVHVIEERVHPDFYGMMPQSIYDVQPDIEPQSRMHMAQMYQMTPGPDVDVEYMVMPGRAGTEISRYAEECGARLIVIGTHGLTGFEHFVMGSTTERVVRRSTVPVLTVKSFGKSLLTETVEMQAVEA